MAQAEAKRKMGPTEVLTPQFRLSYPFLFEARAAKPGDKMQFSLQMIFRVKPPATPPDKIVDLTEMQNAAMAAAIEEWGQDKGKWPKNLQNPFRNGTEREGKAGYGDGTVFVSAKSEYKPGIVDQAVKDIIEKTLIYPGCYCQAKLSAYGWEYMGKFGVSFGLRHVQLIADGEPLGGGTRPADVFDAIPVPSGNPAGAVATPAGNIFGALG